MATIIKSFAVTGYSTSKIKNAIAQIIRDDDNKLKLRITVQAVDRYNGRLLDRINSHSIDSVSMFDSTLETNFFTRINTSTKDTSVLEYIFTTADIGKPLAMYSSEWSGSAWRIVKNKNQYRASYTVSPGVFDLVDSTITINFEGLTIEESWFNSNPTVSVTTTNNRTLYENDTLNIAGTVSDVDNDNAVTVRYQIGAGTVRAIKAFVSTGAAEAFSKQLRFSGGNLYDGDTLIASNLTDGVAHTLKVWATDDQGGTSPIIERTFYVVPNRAPSLSVNTPVISGNIDSDEFEITGSYNDLDKNTTKVAYRINGSSSVQVAEGTGGDFNFRIKFGQLKVGLNTIVIEAIDSYGAKTSRTVKLNKNEVKTEQLKSTARFKIHPPLNTATGIVLWVRRDENLALSASISMTQTAEAENFVQMEKPRTAPMANSPGVVEDQFEYESASPAEKIILQLDMQRSSLTANEKIYLLVGVID